MNSPCCGRGEGGRRSRPASPIDATSVPAATATRAGRIGSHSGQRRSIVDVRRCFPRLSRVAPPRAAARPRDDTTRLLWTTSRGSRSNAQTVRIGGVFTATLVAMFAFNVAVTGEWNYQGGERKTFTSVGDGRFQGGFPFQNESTTFDTVGLSSVGGDRRQGAR